MSSMAQNGFDPRAQALVGSYVRAGYEQIAPPVLQPAEPFLDLSGEDIRRRMFLTTDPDGRELCLRPDLTIPVSRDYLASRQAGQPQWRRRVRPHPRESDTAAPASPVARRPEIQREVRVCRQRARSSGPRRRRGTRKQCPSGVGTERDAAP